MRLYEAVPDGPIRGGLVVIQEAFGVNEYIEDVTRRGAEAGYHSVAPDLFHRSGGGTVPYGQFDKVMEHFQAVKGDADVINDVDAALEHLRGAGFADGQIGIVGFCFGGRVTFLTALKHAIGAAVGFYGGGIVSGRFPQFPPLIDEVASLQTPWLGLFGDQDGSIPVEDVERLRAALPAANVDTDIVRYPEAGHGFHCDRRPDYRPDDAKDAWGRALRFLDEHIAG
ncbi:MAG: putative carboxymethylenebutenolidase [Actinomycetia bacterium]|nr:putative carboxymethylenebutenolidase [Actinomycetes bacterium]